jgi:shikimate kinase
MHQASKIFLIGFMGSGKSTTGRKLASQLNWSFIDLDEKIEEMEGMKIPDIFSLKGEPYFRKLETKALKEMKSETNTVISTGGGTPCFGDNMYFMLSSGLTIYLKMTPASLKKRLTKLSEGRPLLKSIDRKDLLEYITSKLEEREKWYSMAEIIVSNFNTDLSDLLSLIKKQIRQ